MNYPSSWWDVYIVWSERTPPSSRAPLLLRSVFARTTHLVASRKWKKKKQLKDRLDNKSCRKVCHCAHDAGGSLISQIYRRVNLLNQCLPRGPPVNIMNRYVRLIFVALCISFGNKRGNNLERCRLEWKCVRFVVYCSLEKNVWSTCNSCGILPFLNLSRILCVLSF